MCGILGVYNSKLQSEKLISYIRKMGFWQFHRGPDEWGEWCKNGTGLGHNRLSILDIEGGKQPMSSMDGSVHVVFNGEIYNYKEIWDELLTKGYHFKTDHSDTEVIVNGFLEWGVELFPKLKGMFAMGIFDERSKKLFLLRDGMGIKPLYYAEGKNNCIVFASEPKAIIKSGLMKNYGINEKAVPEYFIYRSTCFENTLYKDIKRVEPGYYIELNGDNIKKTSYWNLNVSLDKYNSYEETKKLIIDCLNYSIKNHLISDVPVGLFLSGGVDSSLISALTHNYNSNIEAFTIKTNSEFDESNFANIVSQHLNIKLNKCLIDGNMFLNQFNAWSFYNDDLSSDPSALALMILSEFARERGMKVMLAGEGADELFGGYSSYNQYKKIQMLPKLKLFKTIFRNTEGKKGEYFRNMKSNNFLGTVQITDFFQRRKLFKSNYIDYIVNAECQKFISDDYVENKYIRSGMIFDQLNRLPNDILNRTDRATMAYSLETRVPFLYKNVIELANNLPDDYCVNIKETKKILKEIAESYIPKNVIYRPKCGFDLPIAQWLSNEFKDNIDTFFYDKKIEFLNYKYLIDLYNKLREGEAKYSALLWAWFSLEKWYRNWILNEDNYIRPKFISNIEIYEMLEKYA